jgi:hypothetical protein
MRSTIRDLFSSAIAPTITNMARPSGEPVSIASRRLTNWTPTCCISSSAVTRCRVLRANRSKAATTTTSTFRPRTAAIRRSSAGLRSVVPETPWSVYSVTFCQPRAVAQPSRQHYLGADVVLLVGQHLTDVQSEPEPEPFARHRAARPLTALPRRPLRVEARTRPARRRRGEPASLRTMTQGRAFPCIVLPSATRSCHATVIRALPSPSLYINGRR